MSIQQHMGENVVRTIAMDGKLPFSLFQGGKRKQKLTLFRYRGFDPWCCCP